jgi:hypothetical protein
MTSNQDHGNKRGPASWLSTQSLRWFAAQFLVVVSGILVALALQAWWNERSDRAAERVVLTQMLADLTEDSLRIAQGVVDDSAAGANAMSLLKHLENGRGFSDTLAADFGSLAISTTAAVKTAEYQTLKSKGLSLIKNDSLRDQISSFYEVTGASIAIHNAWLTTAEDRWMPLMLRRFRIKSTAPILGAPQVAYPRNYNDLQRDREFRLFLEEYNYYMDYTGPWKAQFTQKAGKLMSQIRSELTRMGIGSLTFRLNTGIAKSTLST